MGRYSRRSRTTRGWRSLGRAVLVAWVLASAGAATADHVDAVPILDFTGGDALPQGTPAVIGWKFTVSSTIMIDGLGFWDEAGDGLLVVHEVGLWNGDGSTLLVSATVDNFGTGAVSTSPDGFWRFQSVPLRVLPPGDYVVGGTVASFDPVRSNFTSSMPITTVPGVSYVEPRYKSAFALEYPPGLPPIPIDSLGPNLRLGVHEVSIPVLSPVGVAALATLLCAVGAARLRSRKRWTRI